MSDLKPYHANKNYCNCPNCATDNCPAGVDYAVAVTKLESAERELARVQAERTHNGLTAAQWCNLLAESERAAAARFAALQAERDKILPLVNELSKRHADGSIAFNLKRVVEMSEQLSKWNRTEIVKDGVTRYLTCPKGCKCKCHTTGSDCDCCTISWEDIERLRTELARVKAERAEKHDEILRLEAELRGVQAELELVKEERGDFRIMMMESLGLTMSHTAEQYVARVKAMQAEREKLVEVAEAARDVKNDAQGGLTGNCWRVGKPAMNRLCEELAALKEAK